LQMNKTEATKLLKDSRDKIDRIDDKIIDLIEERNSMAGKIAAAKKVLKKDVKDPQREDYIQQKIKKIAEEKKINEVSLNQIMDILTHLNKQEQEKILRR
jgi:chorismate mutase